jgi:hypothetical protein
MKTPAGRATRSPRALAHEPGAPTGQVGALCTQRPACLVRAKRGASAGDAAQLRRLGGRRLEKVSVLFTYYRVCRRVYSQKTVQQARARPRGMGPAARHPKPSHGSGTPVQQQQHRMWAGMAAKHVRVRQEHAPRPNSAVLKCRPMRERNTRRGMWCTHRRQHTRYMVETLAVFQAPMSALNVFAS